MDGPESYRTLGGAEREVVAGAEEGGRGENRKRGGTGPDGKVLHPRAVVAQGVSPVGPKNPTRKHPSWTS